MGEVLKENNIERVNTNTRAKSTKKKQGNTKN